MCLAVPGRILKFDETNPHIKMAEVDFNGTTTNACMEWLPEAKIGDYVLVHVGTAISIVEEQDAKETIVALREMGEID